MMAQKGKAGGWALLLALTALVAVAPGALAAPSFANGIVATIHGPQEIAASLLVEREGKLYLEHPAAGAVELDTSAGDWHPFDPSVVAAALETMAGFTTDVSVDVFVLPLPPRDVASSFARRGAIFLAPASGKVVDQTVAYITVHEMGHVLTWACLDGRRGRWDAYLALRGLDKDTYGPTRPHACQPREILAEDLRALFGGRLATLSGSIENHDLVMPDLVAGLRDLLAGYLADREPLPGLAVSSAWPNPCNPLTTIEMTLPTGPATADGAVLRIHDLRGRLVRTLRGGTTTANRVAIQWRGDDETGGAAASGRYLYVMTAAGCTARGSVTLVR